MSLIQRSVAVIACAFSPALCSAQSPQATHDGTKLATTSTSMDVSTDGLTSPEPVLHFDVDWSTSAWQPVESTVDSHHPAAPSPELQERVEYARSFEQLQVFVGRGDTISVREGSGEEFSARVASLTATELVVAVNGQNRTFRSDDVIRIRQRRGDSLANGTWLGFGIGAGFALIAFAVDNSGFADGAGWAVLAAAVYGGMGAGIGVGIDALIRSRQVIYDHPAPGASTVAVVPLIGLKRAGAMVALRF